MNLVYFSLIATTIASYILTGILARIYRTHHHIWMEFKYATLFSFYIVTTAQTAYIHIFIIVCFVCLKKTLLQVIWNRIEQNNLLNTIYVEWLIAKYGQLKKKYTEIRTHIAPNVRAKKKTTTRNRNLYINFIETVNHARYHMLQISFLPFAFGIYIGDCFQI